MATWKIIADTSSKARRSPRGTAMDDETTTAATGEAQGDCTTTRTYIQSRHPVATGSNANNFRPRFTVHQREAKQIGPIRIESAIASFVYKGEDRFDVWRRCTKNFTITPGDSSSAIIEDEQHASDDDNDDGNSSNASNTTTSNKLKSKKLDRQQAKQQQRYYCRSPTPPPPTPTATLAALSPPPKSPERTDDQIRNTNNNTSRTVIPQLLAYAGVFDGHSGHAASEYCANKGLLSHIVLETAAAAAQSTNTTSTTATTATTTAPSSGNARTPTTNRRSTIGGGGVHMMKPHMEVPRVQQHHHQQNLQYTKNTTAAATAAISTHDVGNSNKSNNTNDKDDDDKDWCPIQNALQEAVAKFASSSSSTLLEVAHTRAFCSAQSRFASGSIPLTLKQVAEKVSEMKQQHQQQQLASSPPGRSSTPTAASTFKQVVMQVIEMNRQQQVLKSLLQQLQLKRNGGYYTRRGAAAAAAAAAATGNTNYNNNMHHPPPSSPGFKKGLLRRRSGSLEHEPMDIIPGGTTACTLSIYCQEEEEETGESGAFVVDEVCEHVVDDVDDDDDDDDGDIVRLSVFAVVANCGDSRLITDNATGGTSFQSVTTDHRPSAPSEAVRLSECCKRGFGHVSCSRWAPATTNQGDFQWLPSSVERLFPGGLAVSRTIGDTAYCKAAVPVPDVYRLCLGSGIVNRIPSTTTTTAAAAGKLTIPSDRRSLLMSSTATAAFSGSRRSVMSWCTTSTADSTGAGDASESATTTTAAAAVKLASPNNRRSLLMSTASTPAFAGSRRSVMSACTVSTAEDSTGGAGQQARTHRFVLATDGLWDMLTIQQVGILAARFSHAAQDDLEHEVAEEVPTYVSAVRIMQECLAVCQDTGHYDDITILVIDVTV